VDERSVLRDEIVFILKNSFGFLLLAGSSLDLVLSQNVKNASRTESIEPYGNDFAIQESNPGALDIRVTSKRPESRVGVTRFTKLRTFLGKYATLPPQYEK
jgi:hypothetical protein